MVTGSNSLFFATALDNTGLRAGKLDAVNIIQSLAGSISKINPFAALAVGAITAFATITKEAYKMAREYEQAMKEVQTISKATQNDFKGVSSDIFAISTETTENPIKLAKAYYQIVSAGYDGAKALNLLRVSSKAAIAGVTDTETAADGITTIMNAFKVEAEDADKVADALFKTVELGKTTFSELSANIAQAAPLAAASGVSFNEVLAAVASLTKQGVPTAQAMTQIRSAIEATNEVMGDGWNNAYTLQEAFQALYKEAGGSQKELKELAGRTEAVSAILAVSGDNAAGAAEDLSKLANSTGSASDAFDIMSSSNINQWELLRNRIKATTEALGNFALETSSKVARTLNLMAKNFNAVSDGMEKQRINLLALQLELNENNTSQERRLEIIQTLKKKYPQLLKNIDSEKSSMDDLNQAIEAVNKSLIDKITLQLQEERITEKAEIAGNTQLDLLNAENALREKSVKLAKRLGIELEKGVDPIVNAQKLAKALAEQERNTGARSGRGGAGVILGSDRLRGEINEIKDYREELGDLQSDVLNLTKQRNEIKISLGLDDDQEIEDVLKKEISEQFRLIAAAKTKAELAPFLISENEKIKAAAADRIKFLKDLYAPDGEEEGKYEDFLKRQLKEYDDFEASKLQIGKDFANEAYKELLKSGDNYAEFLKAELDKTENFERRKAIVRAAEDAGLRNITERAKVEKVQVEIQPIVTEVDIDTTSINAIEAKIDQLIKRRAKQRNQAERDALTIKIQAKQKELDIARGVVDEERKLFENVNISLENLTGQQLNNYIKYWKDRLEIAKNGTDKEAELDAKGNVASAQRQKFKNYADDITADLRKIGNAFSEFGDNTTADLINGLAGISSQLENIFNSFDSEATTGERASAAASGVSSLISLIVSSAAQRKQAEEAYYKSVISFQKEYNQLLNEQLLIQESATANVFTTDYINELENGIAALADANEQYNQSIQDLNVGEVKSGQRNAISGSNVLTGVAAGATLGTAIFPGIGTAIGAVVGGIIGIFAKKKKDLFVGLLQEYPELVTQTADGMVEINKQLAESLISQDLVKGETKILLQDTIDWGKRIEEAREQIKGVVSDLAGGLGDNLREALVGSFEAGTDAAEAMGNSVSEVLQSILEQLIFDQIFSDQFRQLQEEMTRSFDVGGDQSWVDDFSRFFEQGKNLTDDFNNALTEAQAQGNEFGFDLFSGDGNGNQSGLSGDGNGNQSGLSGSISTITEDTAGLLAGYLNAIRADVSRNSELARDSNSHLSGINSNTNTMVQQLEQTNSKLTNIENSLA